MQHDVVRAIKNPGGRWDLEETVGMHMRGEYGPVLQVPFSVGSSLQLGNTANLALKKVSD
jgi:hypothetical protein